MRGVAHGSLGARSFADAAFVVTVVADTAAVKALGPGIPCNDPRSATFAIEGVGSGVITTPISVANNSGWQLIALAQGRCIEAGLMWMNGQARPFETYDLGRDIGPVPLAMPSAPPGITVNTSAGVLVFTRITGLSFQARVIAPTAVPGLTGRGLSLLATVVAGIGAVAARRRRATWSGKALGAC